MRLMKDIRLNRGFTLIEVVVVIMVTGIIVAVAMKSFTGLNDSAKLEATKQEMESLAFAIAGNPTITDNGARTDFGYVGDVGSMPPNLDALFTNPGGYSTWKGPYVSNRFTQTTDDYKRDAWGNLYTYAGGVAVSSASGGGTMIRQIAPTSADLLYNTVRGTISDIDGTPPGTVYKDSITVRLTYPNGSGSMTTKTKTPDLGGYFAIDSIPIGTRDLQVIYAPSSDTISRVIAVAPKSATSAVIRFDRDLWYAPPAGSGLIQYVSNSDSLSGNRDQDVSFWITNTGGSPIAISNMSVAWTAPQAYYKTIKWGATTVFNLAGSPRGVSNATYVLSSPMTINAGASVELQVLDFRRRNKTAGGNKVSMRLVPFTIRLSDGTVINFTTPST